MNKSSFFIIGQHAVIEALKNPKRNVLRVFLTEESKKNIHRKNPNKNLLNDVKVYFKTKKELDKYSTKENLQHQGYVAEIEHLERPNFKRFYKRKNNITLVCLDGVTDPRNIGSLIRSAASFDNAWQHTLKYADFLVKDRHYVNSAVIFFPFLTSIFQKRLFFDFFIFNNYSLIYHSLFCLVAQLVNAIICNR